jgi:hypothetical protein
MTEYNLETLIKNKFSNLKRGDIINLGDRRDLILDESSAGEYPITAIRRVGESKTVSFQIVHYKVDPVFLDQFIHYFGKVIRKNESELYQKIDKKLNEAGITNTTEEKSIKEDYRREKSAAEIFNF